MGTPKLKLGDNVKFILPTAPTRPITLNRGMSMTGWSDIIGLDSDIKEDGAGFNDSATRINSIIQAELDKGIASSKILVAGFSQGGALALHVALRHPLQLAGCVALPLSCRTVVECRSFTHSSSKLFILLLLKISNIARSTATTTMSCHSSGDSEAMRSNF
jgi:hypothetical protein